MADILSLDATAQMQALDSRRVSAVELLEAAVARYRERNPQINAVVAVDIDRARVRAKVIDDLRAKGEGLGPLAGLPMTVKDSFDVEGMPASSGLAGLVKRTATDATAVSRARYEGAVIWGKTNLPVMAGDWQSFNGLYGTTNNPWDLTRTPGGSSGGAAAAVAEGITALEIGSDIGGSLRVPASFCGVYSHKPTHGLVSQRGHVPPAPGVHAQRDLNVVGPIARSARDLRLLLSVMEDGPLAAKAASAQLKGLKVGVWVEEPSFPLDTEIADAVTVFAQGVAAAGAAVESLRPIDGAVLFAAYSTLLAPIIASDMPASVRRNLELMRGPAKLAMLLGAGPSSWAAQMLGYTASHAEWLAANETRVRIADQVATLFERLDVIIAPAAPVVAFPHDHTPFTRRSLTLSDGKTIPYPSMLNWISLATACGVPATTVPIGTSREGLPIGCRSSVPGAGIRRRWRWPGV